MVLFILLYSTLSAKLFFRIFTAPQEVPLNTPNLLFLTQASPAWPQEKGTSVGNWHILDSAYVIADKTQSWKQFGNYCF